MRRLAYEAADCGLLSPELAAWIRRVKGPKKLGVRFGNWLTAREARLLWQLPSTESLKGKRDRAILAILLGCGLRRRELADLTIDHFQRRDNHWAIIDLNGKGGHIRTVPVPERLPRMIFVGPMHAYVSQRGVNWSRSNSYSGMFRCKRWKNILDASSA